MRAWVLDGPGTVEDALALREVVERGDVTPREILRRRIRRRLVGAALPLDRRGLARVYNALRRAGFDAESIRQELEPYGVPTSRVDPISDEARAASIATTATTR